MGIRQKIKTRIAELDKIQAKANEDKRELDEFGAAVRIDELKRLLKILRGK